MVRCVTVSVFDDSAFVISLFVNNRREAKVNTEADKHRQIAGTEVAEARGKMEAELFQQRAETGNVLQQNPSLVRLEELKALSAMAQNANARLYLGDVLRTEEL